MDKKADLKLIKVKAKDEIQITSQFRLFMQ